MQSNIKNNIVAKRNELIEATYELDLNEQRVLLAMLSKHDGKKKLDPRGITITRDEYREAFDISKDNTYVYQSMKDGANRLFERKIKKIYRLNGELEEAETRWLDKKIFRDEVSFSITLFFSERIAPWIAELSGHFTRYELKNVGKLVNFHSLRIYEIVKENIGHEEYIEGKSSQEYKTLKKLIPPHLNQIEEALDNGHSWEEISDAFGLEVKKIDNLKRAYVRIKKKYTFDMTFEELKELTALQNSYPRWQDYKRRILEPAKKDISKHSDISFEYTVLRGPRNSVAGIRFDITENLQKSSENDYK